jgi:hypothetical protein
MSKREQLNLYIRRVQQRLRMDAALRGIAVVSVVALATTVLLAYVLNHYAFPERSITPSRLGLLATLLVAISIGLAWPLLRINRRRSVLRAERSFPQLQQRLLTFAERDSTAHLPATPAAATDTTHDPFLELLAANTLAVTEETQPVRLVPSGRLVALLAGACLATGVLVWLITDRPGYLGYGASLLWTGPRHEVTPLYEIRILPGDGVVRRNSDQMVTAQIVGLETNKATLYARFEGASKWEPVSMQPQMNGSGFQFLFAALAQNVEYYVSAGPASSKHFSFRVVDLPAVKSMQVTYRYPKWTGMKQVSEDHAGDLRGLEGTDADLTVTMTSPLRDGMFLLDVGHPVHLTGGAANVYHGTIHMEKDGAYHVAATDQGQQVRLSEDYFISTDKANPPTIAIDRPRSDYRASPIEEVTIGVKAAADFGLSHVSLHYSVNGGPEQTVNVLKQPGAKDVNGSTTVDLEDFKLVPGDVVSLYATARDAHAEARTDIGFIQIDPFEREFSQSQQSGGGGGGGGQQQNSQTDIARREKELIEATWKQRNDKAATPQANLAAGKLLSEAQEKLREQALALTARMQSRDLSSANEEFNSFEHDMQVAADAMTPSSDKLKQMQWQDAMPIEQKALQALLRAEATFRQIEVAFGQRGGGGSGGGGSAGRDLASLFDLEMDTEKNQYETAQTGSAADQQAKKVDDALAKLDALAKRQEELAQQQNNSAQSFQQRWQQEMLRREAEQLQREMEQMQGQQGQQGGQGQQSASSKSSQSGTQGQTGQSGQSGQDSAQTASSQASSQQRSRQNGSTDGNVNPRVAQALDRLRVANEEMGRAGGQQGGAQGSQSAADARRAADQLRQATNLLGSAQRQQASGKLDALGREADRLAKQESDEANRIHTVAQGSSNGMTPSAQRAEIQRLAESRQHMSDDLSRLQKGVRETARELAPNQPGTSSALRDALSNLDQSDLTNLVQRTADWLRRGVNPNQNGTEDEIATGLKHLEEQVHKAQQAAGSDQDAKVKQVQNPGDQVAALDHVNRLRTELQSLNAGRDNSSERTGQGGRSGQAGQSRRGGQQSPATQQGQSGQQQGQGGQQQGKGGRQGAGSGQRGSSSGNEAGTPGNAGSSADRVMHGGGSGGANYNVNKGNNVFDASRRAANPDAQPIPVDSERIVRQGLNELNQLRQIAGNDPSAQRDIQNLVHEMQQLAPSRFPGNPAMVEQLHAKVINDVDKLELQLRRTQDASATNQVHSTNSPSIPAGYQDAVAAYYRRLSKTQ